MNSPEQGWSAWLSGRPGCKPACCRPRGGGGWSRWAAWPGFPHWSWALDQPGQPAGSGTAGSCGGSRGADPGGRRGGPRLLGSCWTCSASEAAGRGEGRGTEGRAGPGCPESESAGAVWRGVRWTGSCARGPAGSCSRAT